MKKPQRRIVYALAGQEKGRVHGMLLAMQAAQEAFQRLLMGIASRENIDLSRVLFDQTQLAFIELPQEPGP